MPELSVEASQLTCTWVDVVALACTPDGTVGGVVSTIQLAVAGVGSGTPPTVAATEKTCSPSASWDNATGLVHAVGVAASSAHMNVALVDVAWNVTLPVVWFVGVAGEESM